MEFDNLKLSKICGVIRFVPKIRSWTSFNNSHIIGYKLSGIALHDFGYKKMSLDEGCVYFLNQSEPYRVNVRENGESFSVHFTTDVAIDTHSFSIRTENRSEFIKCLEKIETLYLSKGECNELAMYFYRLCMLIGEVKNKEYLPKKAKIYNCREYIDLHFREKDCLFKSAELSEVSRRRFNDVFKNTFDITPARYLNLKRMDYARSLLTAGVLSVSDVALMSGFSDVYYFSKVFRAENGCSPAKFRKSLSIHIKEERSDNSENNVNI